MEWAEMLSDERVTTWQHAHIRTRRLTLICAPIKAKLTMTMRRYACVITSVKLNV